MPDEEKWMRIALEEAKNAFSLGEVPVGAVVVRDGVLVSRACNACERKKDASAHAEMLAMRLAAEKLNQKFLTGCTLYVTLEPCVMCAGAIEMFRPERVVFGARDERMGGCGSLYHICEDEAMPARIRTCGGVLARESAELLSEFFRQRRS
ncbi:MAG: tRNA adenosine(34) deaminase TadA [Eubacteriales bacterium]|nr:tRNA adenosine(34) deaminase TadA [Eubacteriales bacterium]MDD3880864.1 tRNA adenosine(34) deaminase TadA [Eubacteriales bacterium]MDD4511769.1 tRNA adenosine(34) deaminase TadA [Eubacteriales bacterium]